MLKISYDHELRRALFSCDHGSQEKEWFQFLKRNLGDFAEDIQYPLHNQISIPWWSFLNIRTNVKEIIRLYKITLEVSNEAQLLLMEAVERERVYKDVDNLRLLSEKQLSELLCEAGFKRKLTDNQIRNVRKLAALPAAATFSVPGAGKTTEALAFFFAKCDIDDKLLVIAPKNAFGAWEEQLDDCVGSLHGKFVRLRGPTIEQQLASNPRFTLITYQQLARVGGLVADFVNQHQTFVYLDESHRIKSGRGKVTADKVLDLSYLPKAKLIMSGTPMPQSVTDLIPQFSFLYPEIEVSPDSVSNLIKPIYVRTTKGELGLPKVTRHLVELSMSPVQERLYNLMKYEVARQAEKTLTNSNRQAFRSLGRSIMRLLQIVSNPALLADEIGFIHQNLLFEVLAEGDSPKMQFACRRARELASQGKKVLIWSSFRKNVEIIADRLSELGAVYIHGAVDAGDEDDGDTREGKIKIFHDDPNCFVMVANPAAASEGISLHKVCHHAIYVDRTYNAAHYLQSEDRIHRLGLHQDTVTTLEILECKGSIDASVRNRLNLKANRMAEALEDESLSIDPIPYDYLDSEDIGVDDIGNLDEDDIRDLLINLKG